MDFGGVGLQSSQAAGNGGIAPEVSGDGDQTVPHEEDGKAQGVAVGKSYDERFDGDRVKTIVGDKVDQADGTDGEHYDLVADVLAHGLGEALARVAVAGSMVRLEDWQYSPFFEY